MPTARQVYLSQEPRRELEQVRDPHPKPDLRTKAAAILKVAQGQATGGPARRTQTRR
jgi:hypothetical protein